MSKMKLSLKLSLMGVLTPILTGSVSAYSAIDPKMSLEPSALEILSMPERNREAVVFKSKNQMGLANDMMVLAFDAKQTMQVRWKALTLGSLLKGVKSKTDLEKALKDDLWFMRNAALLAYERIFPFEVVRVASTLIKDKALVVRSAAVRTLSGRLNAEARETLWEELDKSYNFRNKQSLWIRGEILRALSRSPDSRELPIFAKTLRDKDSRLHFYSILALEKISHKKLGTARTSLAEKRDLWLKAKL
jgi:HEAT repeat protein